MINYNGSSPGENWVRTEGKVQGYRAVTERGQTQLLRANQSLKFYPQIDFIASGTSYRFEAKFTYTEPQIGKIETIFYDPNSPESAIVESKPIIFLAVSIAIVLAWITLLAYTIRRLSLQTDVQIGIELGFNKNIWDVSSTKRLYRYVFLLLATVLLVLTLPNTISQYLRERQPNNWIPVATSFTDSEIIQTDLCPNPSSSKQVCKYVASYTYQVDNSDYFTKSIVPTSDISNISEVRYASYNPDNHAESRLKQDRNYFLQPQVIAVLIMLALYILVAYYSFILKPMSLNKD